MGKAKLEFVARITTEDGKVIERRVETSEGIIPSEEINREDLHAFLSQFDKYEKSALSARNRICDEITQAWLEEQVKKGGLSGK